MDEQHRGATAAEDGVVTRTVQQVLADQAIQAERLRTALLAEPVPQWLCSEHAHQHRTWGWHDMRPCKRCRAKMSQSDQEIRSAAE